MSRDEIALLRTCPAREELYAFNRGRLALEKLESIAEHLSVCERCESSLQSLQSEDTFLSHLRRYPPEEAVDEFAIVQLADRARALAARRLDKTTVAHDAATEESKAPPLPAAFGAYLLLELLGHGGMGVVYKARQESLKRLVALKLVRAGIHASAEERARFQREGEAIARIKHPHVVQIHECGEHAGQPFFSMELLEGGTLADRLKGGPLPPRAAAELVRSLARAVQAAHQHEVVHRDLKPANVLFAADGTAKITDFGLAKVLDSADNQTLTDVILGTPSYMAPEQARGENRSIGPSTDVYALGAILYETLTGEPPFRADTRLQTLELVRTREPEPPTRRRPELSRDLEAICLKCLEKKTSQRYATAETLADDLGRWLDGEPTQARPLGRTGRAWRTVRRHLGVSAAVVALAGLSLAGFLAWFCFDPERPIRDIEDRLGRGQTVTLIGQTGRPAWFAHGAGGKASQVSQRADGAFTLHTWNLALLELVRDPRQKSYRLQAETRQENSGDLGEVGVYFASRKVSTAGGDVHSFIQWTFNDIDDIRKQYDRLPDKLRRLQPPPQGNPVQLQAHLYVEGDAASPWEHRIGCVSGVFQPAGYGKTDWRKIAVEVTPQSIRAFWEDRLAGEIPTARLAQLVKENLDTTRKNQPDNPFVNALAPDFVPRGTLGLYVHRGSASFRRVVLKPLNGPE
ncbi:MAG TPA: serine/threonine-protein kinase [Gemmataceae bacterium]|jgi:serine/threonine-protein kinase